MEVPLREATHRIYRVWVQRSALKFVWLFETQLLNTNERNPWMGDTRVQETSGCCTYLLQVNQQSHLTPPPIIAVSGRPADPLICSKHPYKFRHTNTNAYEFTFFPRAIPWSFMNSLPTAASLLPVLKLSKYMPCLFISTFSLHYIYFCVPSVFLHCSLIILQWNENKSFSY